MKTPFLITLLGSVVCASAAAQGVFYEAQERQTEPRQLLRNPIDVGPLNTGGWALMTREERRAHRITLQSLKSFEECQAYLQELEDKMLERASERDENYVEPQVHVCVFMQKRGLFRQ